MCQVARWLVVVVGLVGCGGDDGGDGGDGGDGDPPVLPAPTSGARIKISWFEFDDGNRQPMLLVDTARDDGWCDPRRWTDGLVRCTPPADTLRPPTHFADAGCTDGVIRNLVGRHGAEVVDAGGEPAIASLRTLAQVSLTQVWSRDGAGACVGPAFEPGTYARAGAEVPAADLAVIERVVPPSAGRITVAADTTADGLHYPRLARDLELGFDCTLVPTGPDEVVCLPNEYDGIAYRDAACTRPVLRVGLGLDVPAWVGARVGCARRLYEVGAETTDAGEFFLRPDGTCIAWTPPNERWFEVTPREPARMERRRFAAGARLAPIAATSGAHGLLDPWWHDADLGDECTLGFFGPDRVCMPAISGVIRAHFADAACQQPLDLAVVTPLQRPCNLDPAPTFTLGVDGIRRVGPRHTVPAWRRDAAGVCVDTPRSDTPPGSELYTVGESIAADRLLGGRDVVE